MLATHADLVRTLQALERNYDWRFKVVLAGLRRG
jgi:hypothetical protein